MVYLLGIRTYYAMQATDTQPSQSPSCWICRSKRTVRWKPNNLNRPLAVDDLKITDDRYGVTLELWRCKHCQFIFASNHEFNNLVSLYEQLNDTEYNDDYEVRSLQMQWLLKKAREYYPDAKTLLDIGSASGVLIAEATKKGLNAIGIEPSRALVDAAREHHAVELIHGVFPHAQIKDKQFDLVFMVDVIEHVDNPLQLLRDCMQVMHAHSILVVVTPDISSITARMLGKKWWHLRLAHVGYFNRHSFQAASDKAGLNIIHSWRAKWFFRISYLTRRLENYLPIAKINHWMSATSIFKPVLQASIPLNLHDSSVFVLKKSDFVHA